MDNKQEIKPYDSVLHNSVDEFGNREYHIKPADVYSFFDAGNRRIEIPKYQRPYSWTEQNVKDLIKDVNALKDSDQWFLGPMFIIKNSDEKTNVKLLDGQQRTTTIILILVEVWRLLILYRDSFEKTVADDASEEVNKAFEEFDDLTDSIKRVLTAKQSKTTVSRFIAEDTISGVLSNFIQSWVKEKNTEADFKRFVKDFDVECDTKSAEGYPTAMNLKKNFKFIVDFLGESIDNTFNDILFIVSFTNKLIYNLWLIEVPLITENTSIRIFESLNNRGKPLTLIDKFRYRTLIHKDVVKDNSTSVKISKKWKEIYTLFSQTNEDKEDFFQYFFMSKKGEEISKGNHAVFFAEFENHYCKSFDNINLFLDEIVYFLKFLRACKENNTALKQFFKLPDDSKTLAGNTLSKTNRSKIIGLFELSKRAINYSKQIKLLFFKMLRDNNNASDDAWSIFIEMFKINCFTFWKVFEGQTPANDLRNSILEICANSGSIAKQIISFELPVKIHELMYKIPRNDNKVCHFLLVFYTYISESRFLNIYSREQVNFSQVEHLMPRAWMANWRDAGDFKKADSIEYVKKLIENKDFELLNLDEFVQYLKREDSEFEPKIYEGRPFKNTKTVVEYIGNRWILSLPKNITGSNDAFKTKKEIFNEHDGVKYPSVDNSLGINKYENWGSEEIIYRSFSLLKVLYTSLSGNIKWDEFDN